MWFASALAALSLTALSGAGLSNNTCSAHLQLQVLGSGGPELDDGRVSSSYLVWIDGKARVLIDTGTGSSVEFGKAKAKFSDLSAVLFTHFHVDHSGDFASYIKGSYFTDRDQDLRVYGPDKGWQMPSAQEFVRRTLGVESAYGYLHDYVVPDVEGDYKIVATNVTLAKGQISTFTLGDDLTVKATAVHHGPVPAVAWRVESKGSNVALSGDMSNQYGTFAGLAANTDLLVMHNAVPEHASSGAKHLHMTPTEIGKIARETGTRRLVLSHLMNRTNNGTEDTSAAIRRSYEGEILFAQDGQTFSVCPSKE